MDKSAKIIVALVVIAVSGFFIYSKITGWHRARLENAVKKEQALWQEKTNKMEEEINTLKDELASTKGQQVPEEKLAVIFGEGDQKNSQNRVKDTIESEKKQPGFPDIERRIKAFFLYLDDQPYVQSYNFPKGTFDQYQIACEKLSSKLPIVTGEMQSLYNMVRNVAHFYRVIGKKRVFLTKQILENESEVIESVMKTFYHWFTMDDGGAATLDGRPSMTTLYEYSGFILNTLGGRSYLLRRGPKVRSLTTYYCVLILDKANEEELNSKGIDIRPYIKSSLLEIKNQIGLIYQEEYITKLSELSMKYHPG
jgi:hypothetical protein